MELLQCLAVHGLGAETDLEPVVLGRIVRPGDLDAGTHVQMRQAPVEHRGGNDANVDDVDARRYQRRDERIAQVLPAWPVVAADHDRPSDTMAGEPRRERTTD